MNEYFHELNTNGTLYDDNNNIIKNDNKMNFYFFEDLYRSEVS